MNEAMVKRFGLAIIALGLACWTAVAQVPSGWFGESTAVSSARAADCAQTGFRDLVFQVDVTMALIASRGPKPLRPPRGAALPHDQGCDSDSHVHQADHSEDYGDDWHAL